MATGEVFVRRASGLVRNLSSFDALNVNVAMCSPLQGVLWAWTFGPYMFQQVNIALAYFIGMIVVGFGAALTYTLWTIGMPRSGGDYIWFSRTVHPLYGFVINWFLTFVFLNWFGMNCATVGPFFLGSVFVSLGMTDAAAAVSGFTGAIIIGTIAVILSALLISAGMKIYAWAYKILFWAMVVGFVVFVAVCLNTSNSAFIEGFNKAMAGTTTYQGVMDTARDLGWIPGWVAGASLYGLVFPMQNYSWGGFPAYVSGEIRDINKSAWIGVMGGLLVMGAWYVLSGVLLYNTVGYDFLHALAYTYGANASKYPLPFPPYPQNFVLFMTDNKMLVAAVALTFMLSGIYLTPPNLLLATRNVFAWSFDRVVPTGFSKVSKRFSSPTYAVIACTIIGEILMIFVAATTYAVMIINTFMIMEIVLCLVAIATIVFPYTKRDLFGRMPSVVTRRILGVPIMTISGVVMLVFSAFMVYAAYSAPSLGGLNYVSLAFNVAVLLVAIPVYLITYYYHKGKGIDITLQFKEVPPE
jgi:APA family basic amino acid/polyamine antiporter